MPDVANLSPLAFEILKYLCNSTNGSVMQIIDKDTLGIGAQEDFLNALSELRGKNLIFLSREPEYQPGSSVEDFTNEALTPNITNYKNDEPIAAKINDSNGDVCKELDYFLEAAQK